MLDRAARPADDASAARRGSPAWPRLGAAAAGLLGAAGVAVGAAGAHGGAGDLARIASDLMLVHAAVAIAACGFAATMRRPGPLWAVSVALIVVGATLFGGKVSAAALAGWRPLPLAAPAGGFCLIAGWLALALAAALPTGRG